jgi:hypothetical protein
MSPCTGKALLHLAILRDSGAMGEKIETRLNLMNSREFQNSFKTISVAFRDLKTGNQPKFFRLNFQ